MALYRGSSNPVSGIPIGGSASGVSIEDTGGYFTGTNVEDALQELGDGTFDFKASNVSIVDSGARITATDVEGALQELSLASGIDIADAGGYFSGTDLENALQELGDTTGAAIIGIADAGTYFTGTTVEAALQELGASTGGAIIGIADAGSYYTGTTVEAALQEVGGWARSVQIVVTDYTTDTATGDGQAYFHVPNILDGMNLTAVHAEVITAGTTGTTDIQIHNVTQAADMLSTKITIDSTETGSDTAATPAVIDTANDDVAENDLLRIDVDAVSTTAAKGLIVTMDFSI